MFKRFLAWHDKTYKWLFGKEIPETKPVPKMADPKPKPKEVVKEEVVVKAEVKEEVKVKAEVKEETKPEILTLSPKKKNTAWEQTKKAKKIKRARTVKGRYVADDKSTANTNEAWVGGKSPKKKKATNLSKSK
jgi:hypothetical protein